MAASLDSTQHSTQTGECPYGLCTGNGWELFVDERYPNGAYRECRCLLEAEESRRQQRLLSSAAVPAEFRDLTLDALDERHPKALQACRDFVKAWPDPYGRGLLFVGDVGVGKTTLAFAAFNALLARGVHGVATNASRLLRDLRKGVGDKRLDERLDLLVNVDLLLLDDIAAHQTATIFASECFYQVINERYVARRPMIATAMYDVGDWGGSEDPKLAQMWRAIGSRVVARSERFLLGGGDRRMEQIRKP